MTKTAWVNCNACGANDFRELSTVDGWHIGECNLCSLIYINPMPFFAPSNEFSEMSLDFQYTRFQHEITDEILQHDRRQFLQQVQEMERFSGRKIENGRFLDIGCGSGSSVWAAVDLGWEAVGVDIDPALVLLGREQLKVDLRCSPLLEVGFEEKQFDFIRMRDVIEHLPNPYDVLQEVKRLLHPEGFVNIATPNEDALPTQLRLLAGFKRETVATVVPPHHVHGFTPKTLKRIADRVGLKIYDIKTTTPVDPKYVTARNMKSIDDKLHVFAWRAANAIGKGSMLIGWFGKQD